MFSRAPQWPVVSSRSPPGRRRRRRPVLPDRRAPV